MGSGKKSKILTIGYSFLGLMIWYCNSRPLIAQNAGTKLITELRASTASFKEDRIGAAIGIQRSKNFFFVAPMLYSRQHPTDYEIQSGIGRDFRNLGDRVGFAGEYRRELLSPVKGFGHYAGAGCSWQRHLIYYYFMAKPYDGIKERVFSVTASYGILTYFHQSLYLRTSCETGFFRSYCRPFRAYIDESIIGYRFEIAVGYKFQSSKKGIQ